MDAQPPHGFPASIGVFVHHDARLAFFPILKNAHTSITAWLPSVGFRDQHFGECPFPDYEHVAVVRDPLTRYVASVHQVWKLRLVGDVEWEPFMDGVARFATNSRFLWEYTGDPHFHSQQSRVNQMGPNRHLFPLERLELLVGFLADRGVVGDVPVPVLNPTPDDRRDYALATIDHDIVYTKRATDTKLWRSCMAVV